MLNVSELEMEVIFVITCIFPRINSFVPIRINNIVTLARLTYRQKDETTQTVEEEKRHATVVWWPSMVQHR